MKIDSLRLADCRFECLTDGDRFVGLGAIDIGNTRVRSGRLPIQIHSQTFSDGFELARLRFRDVQAKGDELRIRTHAIFRPLPVKLMRDHSFDPIHETGDWEVPDDRGPEELDIVLKPAKDEFNGVAFKGFSYHYEYRATKIPIFYLLDQATWELDGDINGATIYAQCSCTDPAVTIKPETCFTTEGDLHFLDPASHFNRIMTHNLPRWASHQAFDFQFKPDGRTLVGVFDRVDLIRTLMKRDPTKAELKCFDKHIFDQTLSYATSAKKIMINADQKTTVAQQNIWTWITDETDRRARAEFGIKEVPMIPRLAHNFWINFTIESYYKDLLPAAINIGVKELFVDNLNKSDMTENNDEFGNMCGGQQYEVAPRLGGPEMLKEFVARAREHGIRVMAWTNNAQSYSSPVSRAERGNRAWFVRMEDCRLMYGGAYTNGLSILDFKKEEPRRYWVDSLKTIKKQSGLDGYLFDSFYNLGFMPVNYHSGAPTTTWRETIQAMKELQDDGIEFLIESFGPWGQPQHGHPKSYNIEKIFISYKVGIGDGYTTVPIPGSTTPPKEDAPELLYYQLANKACNNVPLFVEKKRIDEIWTDRHKRAMADYIANQTHMSRRYLQEDGKSVIWHDAKQTRATIWNFADRIVSLHGRVTDATTGDELPRSDRYALAAWHTYVVTGAESLPVQL